MRMVLIAFLACLAVTACTEKKLRGTTAPSPDTLTYLLVLDDNGCSKGDLLVDGKPWPYPKGSAGLINPGEHKIKCHGEVSFVASKHSIFSFDYWGP
jgi:hypothetical protein